MKKIFVFMLMAFESVTLFAESLSGYDVMKKNSEVEEATTASFVATMTLTDKNGQKRVREVLEKSKEYFRRT